MRLTQMSESLTVSLMYHWWHVDRSDGYQSFRGVDWDYKIPDPTYKASWRIQVDKGKMYEHPRDHQTRQFLACSLDTIIRETDRNITCTMDRRMCQTASSTPQQRNLRGMDRRQRLLLRQLLMLVWNCKRRLLLPCRALWGKTVEGNLRHVQLLLRPVRNIQVHKIQGHAEKVKRKHMDHTAEKRSMWEAVTVAWCISQFLFQEAMLIPEANAAANQEWENERTFLHGTQRRWDQSPTSSVKRRRTEKTVHFANVMHLCHWMNAELAERSQKYKRRVVLRETTSKTKKDTEQYSRSKVLQRLGRQRQDSSTLSRSFLVWLERQMTQFQRAHRSKWPKLPDCHDCQQKNVLKLGSGFLHGRESKNDDPVVLLERNLYGHRNFEEAIFGKRWRKYPHGTVFTCTKS